MWNGFGRFEECNEIRFKRTNRENSLGKFGLGLKTASTAFCKQFSLISRNSPDSELRKVQWDLDYIANNGSWLLQFPVIDSDEEDMLNMVAEGSSGTLLVWEKIDRLMKNYKNFKNAQNGLNKILEELRFHLSMVFQRYLDKNDSRAQNVEITVNTQSVSPWDPFCTKEKIQNSYRKKMYRLICQMVHSLNSILQLILFPKRRIFQHRG